VRVTFEVLTKMVMVVKSKLYQGTVPISLNDRNLLFSGVAAEVGVVGGGGEIVSVDRVI
jgi:hypothetical protein